MTLKELLAKGREYLNDYEIDTAKLDASLILSHLTGLSKVGLITHDTDKVSLNLKSCYLNLIQKRATGYPVAYILGYKEFWGLKLKVSPATLIPRPDTEVLVETALSYNPHGKILDLGTGSGAIILALKSELKEKVDAYAVDFSEEALDIAKQNGEILNLDVSFIHSNWFDKLDSTKFNLIVSNPPYIEASDEHLIKTSLPYEPLSALASGLDGLKDIRIICKRALDYLEDGAALMLEHGYKQGALVREIFKSNGYKDIRTVLDLEQRERVTLGFKK